MIETYTIRPTVISEEKPAPGWSSAEFAVASCGWGLTTEQAKQVLQVMLVAAENWLARNAIVREEP